MTSVSAYLPCYNNAATIIRAIESIKSQTVPVDEIFVVDDCSTDDSLDVIRKTGVRVVLNEVNLGRGFTRARAIESAKNELVLSCDAGVALTGSFLERALIWMADDKVAAVNGRVFQKQTETLADRWRARHLFKTESGASLNRKGVHTTGGALVKRSFVLSVGNYRQSLRFGEDSELGSRLLNSGLDVVFDPDLMIEALTRETVRQVLDRYCRWNEGTNSEPCWKAYLKQIVYATKVMALQDVQAGDPFSIPISLVCPHYQFWRRFSDKRKC